MAATPRAFGDPILFTDRDTARTFVSQLFGLTPFNGMDYTDDDGATYLPSQGSGIGSGIDHQTIGGGPFHAPIPTGATYAGQESMSNVALGSNAQALSIVAETNGNLPVKLALVSPTGLTLQIVDAVNGVAVLTAPITTGGIYTVKVINVNLGPVQVWTVATPTIAR